MPTILIEGYKFRFYSLDGVEPPHMHVLKGGSEAKVWLIPVSLARSHGYTRREANEILAIAAENQMLLLRAWNDYFRRK